MLLQNIVPKCGLCNGSRLIVTHLSNCIVEARIFTMNMWEKLHSFQNHFATNNIENTFQTY
jgi:hypothetical protein